MKMLFSVLLFFLSIQITGYLELQAHQKEDAFQSTQKMRYESAWMQAQSDQAPVLFAFIKSVNCPWSEKLYKEVLSNPEFTSELGERIRLILVPVEEEQEGCLPQEQSRDWKEQWNIRETPQLLLVAPSGEVIHRVGFLPLKGKKFADYFHTTLFDYLSIEQELKDGRLESYSDQELEALYKKAKSMDFLQLKEQIFHIGKRRSKSPFFLLIEYEELLSLRKRKDREVLELRKKIQSMDAKNMQGVQLRLAMIDFQVNVQRMKMKEDPRDVVEPLQEYMKKFGKQDIENAWRIEMMIAQFLFSKNKYKSALRHAQLSFKRAPEIVKPEIEQTIAYLEKYQSESMSS